MRPIVVSLTLTVTLSSFLAGAVHANVCLPGDNTALQACLDHPDPEKLLAPGTYTLDPAKPAVSLTNRSGITIRAADEDHPPVIQCALGTQEPPRPVSGTLGIVLFADAAVVSDVTVAHLNFVSCGQALLANKTAAAGGMFQGLKVHHLDITNSYLGINLNAVDTASVHHNRVVDSDLGIALFGVVPVAADVDISHNVVVGNPANFHLTNDIGIAVTNANGRVFHNDISHFTRFSFGAGRGITTGGRTTPGEFHLDIVDNDIHDTQIAIATGGPWTGTPLPPVVTGVYTHLTTATGSIGSNRIDGYDYYAITAFHGSSGWTFGLNQLSNGRRLLTTEGWIGDYLFMEPGGLPFLPSPLGGGSSHIRACITADQAVANRATATNEVFVVTEGSGKLPAGCLR